jgi:hypothetical protein
MKKPGTGHARWTGAGPWVAGSNPRCRLVAEVDEAPEAGTVSRLLSWGLGYGLLTAAELTGLAVLHRFAHAVFDEGAGDEVFEHFWLLVGSNRVIWMSRSSACAAVSSVRLPTLRVTG